MFRHRNKGKIQTKIKHEPRDRSNETHHTIKFIEKDRAVENKLEANWIQVHLRLRSLNEFMLFDDEDGKIKAEASINRIVYKMKKVNFQLMGIFLLGTFESKVLTISVENFLENIFRFL